MGRYLSSVVIKTKFFFLFFLFLFFFFCFSQDETFALHCHLRHLCRVNLCMLKGRQEIENSKFKIQTTFKGRQEIENETEIKIPSQGGVPMDTVVYCYKLVIHCLKWNGAKTREEKIKMTPGCCKAQGSKCPKAMNCRYSDDKRRKLEKENKEEEERFRRQG